VAQAAVPLAAGPIETGRLVLTPLREADAPEMAMVLGDPRLHEFTGGEPLALPDLSARYRRWEAGSGTSAEDWLNWIVRVRDTGAVATAAGTVQATVTRRPGVPAASGEIAWVIGVPWQGQGYAAEAATALVAWLTAAGVTPVTASIHPRHRASERVAERAGLAPTSQTVDGERVWRHQPAPAS
jgi:RimJ/RimL family protein N-acetyltransferase